MAAQSGLARNRVTVTAASERVAARMRMCGPPLSRKQMEKSHLTAQVLHDSLKLIGPASWLRQATGIEPVYRALQHSARPGIAPGRRHDRTSGARLGRWARANSSSHECAIRPSADRDAVVLLLRAGDLQVEVGLAEMVAVLVAGFEVPVVPVN